MKRFYSLLTLIAMLFTLTGCGAKESTPITTALIETTVTTAQPTTTTTSAPDISFNTGDSESILLAIDTRFENAIHAITDASTSLLAKLGNSYDTYSENRDSVTGFYTSSQNDSALLYSDIKNMSIEYFKSVANQGLSDYDVWNDAMEDFYDVWNDGMEDYYDTWDELYEDVYDLCDELISDASDKLDYKEYSDSWSDMYENHSDSWSDMYESYSDAWSEGYENYSDVWSGFFDDDSDIDSILKIDKEINSTNDKTTEIVENKEPTSSNIEPSKIETTNSTESKSTDAITDGLRPEFKEAMDSYEAFYEEYCDFMKKYSANPTDMTLLVKYGEMLAKTEKMNSAFEKWDNEDLNNEELKYYLDVQNRVMQMLVDISK